MRKKRGMKPRKDKVKKEVKEKKRRKKRRVVIRNPKKPFASLMPVLPVMEKPPEKPLWVCHISSLPLPPA